ncbi:hypothetical protein [Pedobacter sp. SL55]|uniref:hypothetical protein n=1 Tax=Pedobacter sp. SL55 TaxID=2995161 RepID=UPI0022705585|nr:hypothetical protein [Pedobacter sp. SL55]WAC41092.1 hypothetical protein OVA16_01575 [Pedobacter sp. SL55]
METDNLKSVWQDISTPQKNKEELNLMLKQNSHPVLTSIKKQITIELLGFTAFLFCYFTMFDGQTKPLATNLILITAILIQLIFGYKGFLMQSSFRSSTNLNNDLEGFATKLKSYRMEVILARAFFAIGVVAFFTYNINFSISKFWVLAAILIIFSVQLGLLYRIWSKRINRLQLILKEFKSYAI